jgi:CRISPR system Cascade subunit CasB
MSNVGKVVYGFVKGKVGSLSKDSPWSKGMLAKLRRGIGKDPAEVPDIWEVTLGELPDELQSRGRSEDIAPTEAEWAIHTALTLFALHQQGKSYSVNASREATSEGKTQYGDSFGRAARKLVNPDNSNESAIKRRFDAVMTAKDLTELAHHARGLIQLMKAADTAIYLDYPAFARALYYFQFSEYKNSIRLQWGQDFYRYEAAEKRDNKKGE